MKITFLLPEIRISGAARSTFELANRLKENGNEVCILYPKIPLFGPNKYKFSPHTLLKNFMAILRNIKINNQLNWFDLKANLIQVPTFAEKWIPQGDIIIATFWANVYDIKNFNRDKGKKFHFIRSFETWCGPEDLVKEAYKLPINKIVISNKLKKLIENEYNNYVFGPILNGINFNIFYRDKDDYRFHDPKRIGIIYRNSKIKGIDEALKAFELIKLEHRNIKFVIFGENISKKHEGIIRRLEDVEIHGLVYNEELRNVYNSLDIFIFPSRFEGFGNPPMEAMACGVACIVTDVGAVGEYTIPGKTALVVPINSPKKIVEAINYLLNNENKRQQIAQNGVEHIQRFSWNNSVEKLIRIFEEVNTSK